MLAVEQGETPRPEPSAAYKSVLRYFTVRCSQCQPVPPRFEVANAIGVSTTVLDTHLRTLAINGTLHVEKRGWLRRYVMPGVGESAWNERKLDHRIDASKRERRNCLGCGAPFLSEGKHNRLCIPCRHRS